MNKIKAVFIFGEKSVDMYKDNPDIAIEELLEYGEIERVSFDTEAELIAFTKGVNSALGWNDATRAYNLEDK